MKNLQLFLLATLAAALPLLQSCNDSASEGADSATLVTIDNPLEIAYGYYFRADNGKTYYPSQLSESLANYNPKDGQRAVIYYSQIDERRQGYDYSIKLYAVAELLTDQVKECGPDEEYGDEPIVPVQLSGGTGYDCLISGGYLTLSFKILAQGSETHEIDLIANTAAQDADDPDYTSLELRHKSGITNTTGSVHTTAASFKLGEYDPAVTGKTGIKLRFKNFDESIAYIKIDYRQ